SLVLVGALTARGGGSNTAAVTALTPAPSSANNSATAVTTLTTPGSISGIVTQGTGAPSPGAAIAGATVSLTGIDAAALRATAVTDAGGNYTFSGVVAGSYRVTASAAGFATRWFNNQPTFNSATPVVVNAGAATSGINLALPGGAGAISGRVTLADGITAVANANVSIRTAPASDFVLFTLSTDTNGNYNSGLVLAAGSYQVRAGAPGFPYVYFDGAKNALTAASVVVTANTTTPNINIRLSGGAGGIRGRVTNAAGGPPLPSVNRSRFH